MNQAVRILRQKAAELLAEADRLELAESAPAPAAPTVYTSSRRGPHPPGKSQRWTREHLRVMPGAYKVGRDWCISVEDFKAWTVARSAARAEVARPPAVQDIVAASLAAAGYRRAG